MKTIKVKNTYNIRIDGEPSEELTQLAAPEVLAVSPYTIPLIKPKLLVKEGDCVKTGQPIFFDKRNDRVKFVSPGTGKISQIKYGPRRRIEEVAVKLDTKDHFVSFPKIKPADLAKTKKEDIISRLLEGGLWGHIHEFPFRKIANPDHVPPAIYVSIDDDEPFKPNSEVFLEGKIDLFKFGVEVLKKLTPHVIVGCADSNQFAKGQLGSYITHYMKGSYPANRPGVTLHYHKRTPVENKSWYITGQDLIAIAEFLSTGQYPVERIVVMAGSGVEYKARKHYKVRLGFPISALLKDQAPNISQRYILGGVFTGRTIDQDFYFSYLDNALLLLPDKKKAEFLTYMWPGADKPSFSRAYLSSFLPKKEWEMYTCLNGGDRDCIACGACMKVCPVELFPQHILKNLTGDDLDEALRYGLLDCVECGLCTYVCPSKIELDTFFRETKQDLDKEINS